MTSNSTGEPSGRLATPKTRREEAVWAPKTSRSSSDAASATFGCSVNSGVAATYTPSLTTRLTRFNEPNCFHLHTFHDADGALRAGAECLKRLLVSLAFVSRPGDVIAVEFDKDRRLLQSGFVGLHLARGHGQKAPAE